MNLLTCFQTPQTLSSDNKNTEIMSTAANNHQHSTVLNTEKNKTAVDSFREPVSTPLTKKKKLSQLSCMVSQLKEIAQTANSQPEENEFEVFGKHVGLQLKSMPLLLALGAQDHIQLFLSKIRRKHLQEQPDHRNLRMSESPCTSESPFNNSTTYYSDSNDSFVEHSPQAIDLFTSQSISAPQILLADSMGNDTIISNNLIEIAMENAHVDHQY